MSVVSTQPSQSILSHAFEHSFSGRLRATAAQAGGTVNDVLIRALLLTIRQWNRQHRDEQPEEHLRVLVPMNLRRRQDLEMPAINRMSYAIVTRSIRELADPQTLLKTIARETSNLRRNCMPQRALGLLSMLDQFPWGIASVFTDDRCLATAVLSNVGDPTRRFRVRFPRQGGLLAVGNAADRFHGDHTHAAPDTGHSVCKFVRQSIDDWRSFGSHGSHRCGDSRAVNTVR